MGAWLLFVAGCATGGPEAPSQAGDSGQAGPSAQQSAPAQPVAAAPRLLEPVEKPLNPGPVRVSLLVGETILYGDGTVDRRTSYSYETGSARLLAEDHFDGSDRWEGGVAYEYEDGLLSRKTVLDETKQVRSYRVFTHTPWGVATDTLFNSRDEQQSESVYEYDIDERLVKWSFYDGSGMLLGRSEYRYEGALLDRVEISGLGGVPSGAVEYIYEPEGILLRESVVSAVGDLEKYVEYDYARGDLIRERFYAAGGELLRSVKYHHDGETRVIRIEHLGPDGRIREIRTRSYIVAELEGA